MPYRIMCCAPCLTREHLHWSDFPSSLFLCLLNPSPDLTHLPSEALLWLYRSHGEHKKVLSALSEERCVGSGAVWSRDSYYQWVAEYLQWLWFQDDNALPSLILPALKPVIEYNPTLGLSILIHGGGKKYPVGGLGGKGVSVVELIQYLESLSPTPTFSSTPSSSSSGSSSSLTITLPTSSVLPSTPLYRIQNGFIISLIYLEWLVGSNQAAVDILDLYPQSLMKLISFIINPSSRSNTATTAPLSVLSIDHTQNILTIHEQQDTEEIQLYKLSREKLQVYLQSSLGYRVERIMKFLPKVRMTSVSPCLSHGHRTRCRSCCMNTLSCSQD
jgi:hypothetical protein